MSNFVVGWTYIVTNQNSEYWPNQYAYRNLAESDWEWRFVKSQATVVAIPYLTLGFTLTISPGIIMSSSGSSSTQQSCLNRKNINWYFENIFQKLKKIVLFNLYI